MIIKHFFENRLIEDVKLKKTLTEKEINILYLKKILIIKKIGNKVQYIFNFVGFLNFNDILIIIFPKYIPNLENKYNDTKDLMKIFERYFENNNKNNESLDEVSANLYEDNFSLYSYYKYLLSDFLEVGIYSNHKIYSKLNGDGNIEWEKTINEVDPFIKENKNIFYFDLYTSEISRDNEAYIKRLHEYYLSKASKYLFKLNTYGFNFPNLNFEISELNLGTKEYKLFRLNKELNITFSDRKIKVLKILKNLIEKEDIETEEGLILYGTTAFYDVWEKACGYVFKNEYNKFKKYIDKPIWSLNNNISFFKDTLIPDIIVNSNNTFYILDAKYYLPNVEKKSSFPGIQDITKQYLYELAFSKIDELKQKNRKNLLIIPTPLKEFELFGKVELKFLKDIGLQDIQILSAPVKTIFNLYCRNKKLDIDLLINNLNHVV
ncbi:LlaJI family restriction endonuclease [Cetobacterium sp.]|uniref:LlaJI family restriction endonuclease n=1 Tax=Cetobacterium sp. TaxID=2071632 RepID=UPI003F314D6F